MKTLVCVKIVDGDLNPFDACALEAALCIDDNEVTVISMGPSATEDRLTQLTRLGVGRVILISDKAYAGSDTLATSYILSSLIKTLDYDLILCGRQSIDGDTAQVGVEIAAMCEIPCITGAMSLDIKDGSVHCSTRYEGEMTKKLPCLVTVERINTLRFPSIRSKVHDIEKVDNGILKLDLSRCGFAGSPTKVLETFHNTEGRRKCRFIGAEDFLSVMTEEIADKKTDIPVETRKSSSVCVIGKMTQEQIHFISDSFYSFDSSDVSEIISFIRERDPDIVLFPATSEGRRIAPAVAAGLGVGLCADCTNLVYDGEKLIMYRPAKQGNTVAKIISTSRPQMATVRVSVPGDDIVLGVGRGAIGDISAIEALAERLGADVCATRAVVDGGHYPYEKQVGLTGKQISPRIYAAFGVSGAIQHIAGIMSASRIIAINRDKDADIFDYSDYGIVGDVGEILAKIMKSFDQQAIIKK